VISFRKPVVIAASWDAISAAALIIVIHTNLIIDKRPPLTSSGTTFHAVKDAGAEMTPTQPESPVKVPPAGPEPLTPPSGKK
jgi:hypothetical protein